MSAQQTEQQIPTLHEAVIALGSPPETWVGNCYAIAYQLVEAGLVEGRAVYGHYLGPIAKDSFFSEKGLAVGFVPHGWVLMGDGRVLDPTRWVFENVEPYIYVGEVGEESDPLGDDCLICYCGCIRGEHEYGGFCHPCLSCGEEICCDFDADPQENPKRLEYDEGGNTFREQNLRPAPAYSRRDRPAGLVLEPELMHAVQSLLGGTPELTVPQAHWLATLPLKRLGEYAEPLFLVLVESDLRGLIPIDNRRSVLGF
jgi:hypothetical protein